MVRAPVRLPLGGGGTDLLFYSSRFGGLVLSVAIDKYVYIMVNRPPIDERIRVKARINEDVADIGELKNDLVRASLEYTGLTKQLEIAFMSDVSDGTGLGTSGSYSVALMQALQYFKKAPLGPQELAEAASRVEIDILKRPIGKHDQYMAAFGGIRVLRISTDGSVKVEEPFISQDTLDELKTNLLLFYTGEKHESTSILGEQKRLVEEGSRETLDYYHRIKFIGLQIIDSLESGDLVRFGRLMHEHWLVKRNLAGGVSNPRLDTLYALAVKNGALGGKVMGAGGGGFFVFFCERNKKKMLRHALTQEGLREIRFSYDWQGSVLLPNFTAKNSLRPARVFFIALVCILSIYIV
jgi:D-glycero-alpha-D-manno-heptose-7-phosphate kinase